MSKTETGWLVRQKSPELAGFLMWAASKMEHSIGFAGLHPGFSAIPLAVASGWILHSSKMSTGV